MSPKDKIIAEKEALAGDFITSASIFNVEGMWLADETRKKIITDEELKVCLINIENIEKAYSLIDKIVNAYLSFENLKATELGMQISYKKLDKGKPKSSDVLKEWISKNKTKGGDSVGFLSDKNSLSKEDLFDVINLGKNLYELLSYLKPESNIHKRFNHLKYLSEITNEADDLCDKSIGFFNVIKKTISNDSAPLKGV